MIGLGRIRRSGKPAAYDSVESLTVAERNIRKNDPDAKNRSENCGGKNSCRQKRAGYRLQHLVAIETRPKVPDWASEEWVGSSLDEIRNFNNLFLDGVLD